MTIGRNIRITLVLSIACCLFEARIEAEGIKGLPIEMVTLTQSGVYPEKIVRTQGEFILFIRNRLPQHQNTYTLTATGSNASATASAVLTTDEYHDCVRDNLSLTPGQYVLKFASDPQYTVTVTITAP